MPITVDDFRTRYASKSGVSAFADAVVQARIDAAVDQWQELARVAIDPTTVTIMRLGDGSNELRLRHLPVLSVASVTVDGVTLASTSYVLDGIAGILYRRTGVFGYQADVEVTYDHGLDEPPGAVVDAILQRALELLVPSDLPGRTTSVASDLGFNRISIAGRDGSTGVPDFDSTAALYGRQGAFGGV